jgi:hypothetical protein
MSGAGEARGAEARTIRDARWGRYHVLQNALYVIPGGAALVSALLGYTSPVVAGLVVVGAAGVGIAADVWRYTHYSCGQCQRRLPAPKRWWEKKQPPNPIAFECSHCDVVWVTRMSAEE